MIRRVYPVIDTGEKCNEYRIKINGEQLNANTCRVSKEPFTRHWPGHRRQIDQNMFRCRFAVRCRIMAEYSAGGGRHGSNRRIAFRNIRVFGKQDICIGVSGFD